MSGKLLEFAQANIVAFFRHRKGYWVAQLGYVDIYGYASSAGAVIVGGWIDFGWDDQVACCDIDIAFDGGTLSGKAMVCTYDRPDVKKFGRGFILHLPAVREGQGGILTVTMRAGPLSYRLLASHTAQNLPEAGLATWARQVLSLAPRSENRAYLLKLFMRSAFNGEDTLSRLPWPVFMEFDAIYFCPPSGLLLRGWFADPFRQIQRITIRSRDASHPIDPLTWIRIPRPDVTGALQKHGFADQNCGFLAFVPDIYLPGEVMHLEFESAGLDLVHKRLPPPQSTGINAIKEMLETFELRYDELASGYERVVGPAVKAMNMFRLASRPAERLIEFGDPIDTARCSIIIPLYGRLDFMEYQLAFFDRHLAVDHELIYVVDDPFMSTDAQALGVACFARFGRPFRLLCLGHNVGYAPANNIGLRYARGKFVCFLNSDVFPDDPDWLENMLDTAGSGHNIGCVGALLLFEDGTVQHEGCTFERLPEFGGWNFCQHPNKGRIPAPDDHVTIVEAVTGACLVLSRQTALSVGGFDEGYVIGDFEDADLCLKIRALGLRNVVDRRARLYHLERQSQGDQARRWRTNLTLYNAWRFHNKWDSTLNTVRLETGALYAAKE